MSTPLAASRGPRTLAAPVRRPRPTDEPGIRFAIGEAVLTLAILVAAALGLGVEQAFVVLTAVALFAGLGLSARWTVGLAASGWALSTGFVEHGYGDLSLGHDDLVRLALALAAGVVAGVLGGRETRRG